MLLADKTETDYLCCLSLLCVLLYERQRAQHVKLIPPLHVTLQQARAVRAALSRAAASDFDLHRLDVGVVLYLLLADALALTFTSGPTLSSQRRVHASAALCCAALRAVPSYSVLFFTA